MRACACVRVCVCVFCVWVCVVCGCCVCGCVVCDLNTIKENPRFPASVYRLIYLFNFNSKTSGSLRVAARYLLCRIFFAWICVPSAPPPPPNTTSAHFGKQEGRLDRNFSRYREYYYEIKIMIFSGPQHFYTSMLLN